jgi:metal-responsive CopG/Arc/MetJ family transcriptional regulator
MGRRTSVLRTSQTEQTSVRIPHEVRQEVERIARERGEKKLSAVVIELLRQALAKKPDEPQSAASPAFSFSEN